MHIETTRDMKKKLVNYTIYDSTEEISYEDYKEFCEDMGYHVCPEDSEGYWDAVWRQKENDWEDFTNNLEYARTGYEPCMLMGSVGLWNGRRDIVPMLCDNIYDAVMKALSGNYDKEVTVELNDGHLDVYVSHHDGTHSFEIWLLSEKGKVEVERPIYKWEKDYEPKRWWFKKIYGYLF